VVERRHLYENVGESSGVPPSLDGNLFRAPEEPLAITQGNDIASWPIVREYFGFVSGPTAGSFDLVPERLRASPVVSTQQPQLEA